MRCGLYPNTPPLPFTPGYDVVGVVDKLGDGVSSFTIGQTVAALTKWGGCSQFVNLPVSELTSVPTDLDPAEAVSLNLNLLLEHQIQPLVSERLPLHEAPRAHELLEQARVSGKIVLLPQAE